MSERLLFRFAGAVCVIFLTVGGAYAQQKSPTADANDSIAFFYQDPRPERVPRIVEQYEKAPFGEKWEAYPPFAGLLAVIFERHPDQIDKLIPSTLSAKIAETVVAALQLSKNEAAYKRLLPRLQKIDRDGRLATEFAGLPSRIEALQIHSPTHLDIVWGASFASGDPKFVRMILDFYAHTANRSEPIAVDVAQTALAIAGGAPAPKLGPKYGDVLGKEILFAGVALWGLRSNGQQHVYVDKAIGKYVDEHPRTFATKGLAALTGRKI